MRNASEMPSSQQFSNLGYRNTWEAWKSGDFLLFQPMTPAISLGFMLSSHHQCWDRSHYEQVKSGDVLMYIWIASWCDDVFKIFEKKFLFLSG